MGASQSQFDEQPELHPQQQSQQFPPQPDLHPQPPQSQPLQRRPLRQSQPPPQPQQSQQPQSHEPSGSREVRSTSRRETLLLSPQAEFSKVPSVNSTKTGQKNATAAVKANENQSMIPVKPKKELINFPHNYEHILKGADSSVDKSSREKLYDQLSAGVFLDHKTKKYWLEKNSNSNCFMLYARALSITWAEDQNYWKWVPQNDESGTVIEVAELNRVCWLEVHGKFDTRKLSPGISYRVSFIVMLKDPAQAQGWEVPVNVRLVLPGGKKQQHQENLIEKLRARWIEIPVGEFVVAEKDAGEMEVSMFEYEGGMWKQGLVIKGVAIKPKN